MTDDRGWSNQPAQPLPATADQQPPTEEPGSSPPQAATPYPTSPWWSGAGTTATLPGARPDTEADTAQLPPPPDPPASPPSNPERRGPRRGQLIGAGALVLALALGSGLAGAELALQRDSGTTASVTTSGTVVNGGSSPSETLAKVAAAVQPSVVSIKVQASGGSDEGSGVIMSSDGTILTNNHVIEAAASGGTITVTFADGKTADATIVGRDAATDLAVIKAANVSGLKPATFGDSDSVHVGDTVLAIGSPLGLQGSVSAGIISALHRPVDVGSTQQQDPFGQGSATPSTVLNDAIQTDAPINPGNSGGPLVDAQGRVIGINSAIASLSSGTGQSGNIGVGFAIPVDEAQQVAKQLANGDKVTRAVLGVQASDVTSGGARVEAVTASGGAAKAGVQVGDVITKVDGATVDDATALTAAIRAHQPGDTVTLTLSRSGQRSTVRATLGSA
ncbi:MAG: putative serine protease PepD [Actinomycetota bacterium]|nr:putative serine protease PepD [Actinomycetota bacterium]